MFVIIPQLRQYYVSLTRTRIQSTPEQTSTHVLWNHYYIFSCDILRTRPKKMYWSETGFSDPTMRIEIPVNMLKFKNLCLKNNLFCLQYAMIMLLFSTKEFQRGPNWKLLCTKSVFKSNGFNFENEIWIFFFKGHITRTYFYDSKGNHIKIKCIQIKQ